MNTIAQETRKQAYLGLLDQLPGRRREVYQVIAQHNGITAHEIKKILGLGLNQVTGRINELAEQHFYIKAIGTKQNNQTEVKNTLWAVTTRAEAERLKARKLEDLEQYHEALKWDDSKLFVSEIVKALIHKEKTRVSTMIKRLKAA